METLQTKGIILNTPFISIKKELAKQNIKLSENEKINNNIRSEIDVNTAFHYLKNLAFRTEATLIKQQNKGIDNNTINIENTLKRIIFIQNQFTQLDIDNQTLKRENQLLNEKLSYFNNLFKL